MAGEGAGLGEQLPNTLEHAVAEGRPVSQGVVWGAISVTGVSRYLHPRWPSGTISNFHAKTGPTELSHLGSRISLLCYLLSDLPAHAWLRINAGVVQPHPSACEDLIDYVFA
jgi:hypothetical protein